MCAKGAYEGGYMINVGTCSELIGGITMVDCWLSHLGDDLVVALITRGKGDLVSYNVVMFGGYSEGWW